MIRLLFALVMLPVLLCVIAVMRHEPLSAWALANIAIYPLVTLGSIALHEAGHALAARAVGLQVPRVEIGIGRSVARWRWAQTTVALNALPFMGLTYIGGEHTRSLRLRYWISIAAGPAVTLAIVAAVMAVLGTPDLRDLAWPSAAVAARFSPLELVGFANAWLLLTNLAPIPTLRSLGLVSNDGTQLLTVPLMPATKLDTLLMTAVIVEAQELGQRDEHEAAERVLEATLKRFPGSWVVLNSLAVAQLGLDRLVEARASFLQLLESEPPAPEMRWIARNNLALVDYLLHEDGLRAEADGHSEAVLERFKHAPWAMGTRGAVLSWLGRHQEAIALLQRAYLRNSQASHRALNAAGVATGLAALDRPGEAAVWLARARANHAACRLLAEADAAVAAATLRAAAPPVESPAASR